MAPLSDKTNSNSELLKHQESFRESFRASALKSVSTIASDSEDDDDTVATRTPPSNESSLLFSPSARRQLSTKSRGSENSSLIDKNCQIGEVVFDILKAEGVDLSKLPYCEKSIAFSVDPSTGALRAVVGREYQTGFFERVVPRKESLACISRSHFQVRFEPDAEIPTLCKLTRNPMLVNNLPIGSEAITLTDKSVIGFKGTIDWAPCFLNLVVTFRSRGTVELEGPHPSLALTPLSRQISLVSKSSKSSIGSRTCSYNGLMAVLECVHSEGVDLASMAADARVIPLCANQPLEVGRSCQSDLFSDLLQHEKQTLLKMVSRRHCRVQLCTGEPPADVDGADQVESNMKGSRSMWALVKILAPTQSVWMGTVCLKAKAV